MAPGHMRRRLLQVCRLRRYTSTLPSFTLQGKNAIVTGGAQGIGREIVKAFAQSGCANIAILDRNYAEAQLACDMVRQEVDYGDSSVKIRAYECDVTQESSTKRAFDDSVRDCKSVHILAAVAGICENISCLDYPLERFKRVYDINVFGLFLIGQLAAQHMKARSINGSMIFISSMSAQIVNRPQPQAAYNSSKAAVAHLTRSMAAELAPEGIRVNALAPGYMNTSLVRTIIAQGGDDYRQHWIGGTPMGRLGNTEDLAGPAVFMASDASKFMTGHELVVDGGYTLW